MVFTLRTTGPAGSAHPARRAQRRARLTGALLGAALALSNLGCSECEIDYDCPGTQICADGVCEAFVCRRDEDCPPGNLCAENTCRENPAQPAPDAPDAVVIYPGR